MESRGFIYETEGQAHYLCVSMRSSFRIWILEGTVMQAGELLIIYTVGLRNSHAVLSD